jgi:hypothetical protein
MFFRARWKTKADERRLTTGAQVTNLPDSEAFDKLWWRDCNSANRTNNPQ